MRQSDLEQQLADLPDDLDREMYDGDIGGYGGPQGAVGSPESSVRRGAKEAGFVNRIAMTNRVYAVTATASVIVPANIYRKYLIMINTGPDPILVSFGGLATLSNGVPILSGGNYEPWIVPYSQVTALCTPGNSSTLVVVEGFYENL